MTRQLLRGFRLSVLVLLIACSPSIEIDDFDSKSWKSDRNGCQSIRGDFTQTLLDSKGQILGQNERAILKLLGRPDKNELYRRQQKFYIYYVEAGPLCEDIGQDSASYVSIRFNATGYAREMALIN